MSDFPPLLSDFELQTTLTDLLWRITLNTSERRSGKVVQVLERGGSEGGTEGKFKDAAALFMKIKNANSEEVDFLVRRFQ